MLESVESMVNVLPPEFREHADIFWARSMSGELDGQILRGRIVHKDGRTVWTDAIGRVVDWDGEPAFQITVVDVTEQHNSEQALRDSEERFRVVAENANDLITIRRADGVLSYASPSSIAITGYYPEELINSPAGAMTYTEDKPKIEQRRFERAAGNDGAAAGVLLWRMKRKDGRLVWLETTSSILPLREGETAHRVLSMSRDVTDRVEREREIEAARDRLARQAEELSELAIRLEEEREKAEEANVAKSQFLAMMSHELRTPMTGVLGMVDLLNKTKVDTSQRNMLATLHRSASALLELLNDILDFSKIEAGEFDLEIVDFRLSRVLKDVRELFDPVLSAKGLSLTVNVQECVEDVLRGDPTRLRQVLLNLIGNANKFTEEGGVTVNVHQSKSLSGDISLRFEVVDTGIGIAAEDQHRLFHAFVQAESNTTRKFGGTGLGLAICKQLVEAMGGVIWVDSEIGEGSTFTFTCPSSAGDPIQADLTVSESSAHEMEALPPLSILIAEDNPTTQMLVKSMLERDGHTVVTADNGALAVEAAERQNFDIVLMDMQMPVMDGPDAMRKIRSLGGGAWRIVPLLH
jgi:PAS domain S-box-containing protein